MTACGFIHPSDVGKLMGFGALMLSELQDLEIKSLALAHHERPPSQDLAEFCLVRTECRSILLQEHSAQMILLGVCKECSSQFGSGESRQPWGRLVHCSL